MQLTLKKFSEDPKHLIKKTPLIILVNRQAEYAVIPYSLYKAKYEEPMKKITQNAVSSYVATTIDPTTPKQHSKFWHLLFS